MCGFSSFLSILTALAGCLQVFFFKQKSLWRKYVKKSFNVGLENNSSSVMFSSKPWFLISMHFCWCLLMDLNSSFLFANGHNTVTFTLNCLQVYRWLFPSYLLPLKQVFMWNHSHVKVGLSQVREKLFKVKEKLTFLIPLKARRIIWGHYDLKDIFPYTKEGKFVKNLLVLMKK